jgi:hypothetical protein
VRQDIFLLFLSVQTESGAHSASYTIATGGFFTVGKATGAKSYPVTSSADVNYVGAIPLLPHTPPCCGVKLIKYREKKPVEKIPCQMLR